MLSGYTPEQLLAKLRPEVKGMYEQLASELASPLETRTYAAQFNWCSDMAERFGESIACHGDAITAFPFALVYPERDRLQPRILHGLDASLRTVHSRTDAEALASTFAIMAELLEHHANALEKATRD